MDEDHNNSIDSLLERYLHLLHEYTSLREELTALQSGIYQNIARANFAAERGLRFGQDYYDDRMQASRLVVISYPSRDQSQDEEGPSKRTVAPSADIPSFAVTNPVSVPTAGGPAADIQDSDLRLRPEPAEAKPAEPTAAPSQAEPETRKGAQTPKDPLRWFGLLTPMPLRQAQTQSVRAVERVVPRLASVNAEMAAVEIEVRRVRKRRAKAEAAASKLSQQSDRKQEDLLET